jgi:hypothetical protein
MNPENVLCFILQLCRHLDYITWNGKMVDDEEVEINCKEAVVAKSRSYSRIYLEGRRRATKSLNQDSQSPGLGSNQESPEYRSRALLVS